MKNLKIKQTIIVAAVLAALAGTSLTGCGSDSSDTTDTADTTQTSTTEETDTESADTESAADDAEEATVSVDDYVLKIGTDTSSLCLAPLHIAEDLGFFDEEFEAAGLEYELVAINIQNVADLIASGQVDASVSLAGSVIPMIDSGLDITFTAGLHTGCTKYYVLEDSGIESVADLKGANIGVPGMSDSSVVALKRKLYSEGISVSEDNMEVTLTVYNMTDLPLALENGAVDAIALHDPVATSSEEEYDDFLKILDLSEDEMFAVEYCCSTIITSSIVEEHPEAAAAFTRAMMRAAAYIQANPEEAAQLQIDNEQMTGDVETNAAMLATYNYSPSVSIMEETIINAYGDLVEIGDMTSGLDTETFVAEHFAALDGVPESYTYNEDGTYTEVEE